MSHDRLKALGYEGVDLDRFKVTARRAKQSWPCHLGANCKPNRLIEWDELYVERVAVFKYTGPRSVPAAQRLHVECAASMGYIARSGDSRKPGGRKSAIAATKSVPDGEI